MQYVVKAPNGWFFDRFTRTANGTLVPHFVEEIARAKKFTYKSEAYARNFDCNSARPIDCRLCEVVGFEPKQHTAHPGPCDASCSGHFDN